MQQKSDIQTLRDFIKFIAARRGYTLNSLVIKMQEKYDWKPSVPNFSSKMRRGTLTVKELYELGELLDYDFINIEVK